MKLRYYLRGLGTGILAATLVFAATGNKGAQAMTDSEMLAGVEELSEQESDIPTQEQEVSTQSPAESKEETEQSLAENEETAEQSLAENEEETEQPLAESEEETEQSLAESEETAEQLSAKNKETEEMIFDEPQVQTDTVIITINRGDASETVSKKVEQAGLVDSAQEYNSFLCNNGYDKKLRVGKHLIPVGAGETEIAEILIGR